MGWRQVVVALALVCCAAVDGLTVSSSVGLIEGFDETWKNETVHTFLGIPYAKAPTGDLRFRAPVPKPPHQEIFKAKEFGAPCVQNVPGLVFLGMNSNVSEDCLSLNVYVPKPRMGDLTVAKRAVMVWIYGGGYTTGMGAMYDGKMMAAEGDVIVVTLNYRLGIFGFITTNDNSARGNYGLQDQQLALQWVQKNIEAFGGDRDLVTIFGVSAGAGSVSWLMLAPSNQGLFKRVIAQSGVASNPWSFPNPKKTFNYTKTIAKHLGCDSYSTTYIVNCLRKKKTADFGHEVSTGWPLHDNKETPAGPRVDGLFIPISPACSMRGHRIDDQHLFRSVDFLAGANKAEAEPFYSTFAAGWAAATKQNLANGVSKAAFEYIAKNFGGLNDHGTVETLWDRYKDRYDGMSNDKELLEFAGDAIFYKDIMDMTYRHGNSSRGSTYFYSFLPMPSKAVGSLRHYYSAFLKLSPYADGAIHGDDIFYFFGNTTMWAEGGSAPGEKELSEAMITYWTNFAKTGNPNTPVKVPHEWPEYKVMKRFIELDIKNKKLDLRTGYDYRGRYMAKWKGIKPRLQSYCPRAGASTIRDGLTMLLMTATTVMMALGFSH